MSGIVFHDERDGPTKCFVFVLLSHNLSNICGLLHLKLGEIDYPTSMLAESQKFYTRVSYFLILNISLKSTFKNCSVDFLPCPNKDRESYVFAVLEMYSRCK
jgi:hypothetical protein